MRGASTKHVDKYMATVCNWFRAALWEAQAQSTAEAQWQKQYYEWNIGTMEWADAFKGKRKIEDRWEDETFEVVHQIVTDVPSYEVMD